MRRRVLLSGRLLLLLCSASLAIAVTEIALRLASPVAGRVALVVTDPVIGWRYKTGSAWSSMERSVYFHTNSLGFRDVEHQTSKPADTIRIAVLGDSFTDALQVDLDETFWKIVERTAQACSPGWRVEVLNFGMGGFSSAQELLTLRRYAIAFAPDIVLLEFLAANDVAENSPEIDRDVRRPFLVMHGEELAPTRLPAPRGTGALDAALRMNSRAYSLARRALWQWRSRDAVSSSQASRASEIGHYDEAFHEPRRAVWQRAWALTDRLLRAIVEEVRDAGATPIVLSATAGFQVSPNAELRARARRILSVERLDYPEQRVARLAEAHRFRFVPLVDALLREAEARSVSLHGESVPDMGHWNAAGHAVVGREAGSAVCEAIGSLPRYDRTIRSRDHKP